MPVNAANHAAVRRTLLKGKKLPDCLSTLDNVCSAGAQCTQVQASPMATQALGDLKAAVTSAQSSLVSHQALAQSLLGAAKTLRLDFEAVKVALGSYQTLVGAIAGGDASVINKAGLLSRDQKAPPEALGAVTLVFTKPGKNPGEAIVNWPAAPGASSYTLEVNYTVQAPGGTWVSLGTGTSRRRVVKAPTPGAQLLARVAAVGSDTVASGWSDVILVTAH
jgi:hypothetical protein